MADPRSSAWAALQVSVRQRADRLVSTAADDIVRYLGRVVANNPHREMLEVVHRPDVLRAIDEALHRAHIGLIALASAAYQAGMRLARSDLRAELTSLGYPAPDVQLWPSRYLDAVLGDLDRRVDYTKTAVLHLAGEAYRSVTAAQVAAVPNPPTVLGKMRALAVGAAVARALDGLGRGGRAATAVLVTRAHTEITQDGYQQFGAQHPTLRLGKEWYTTSAKPCATCRALDGTVVGLDQQFDHHSIGSTPPVYRDLLGPPRHPGCGCGTRLVVVPAVTVMPVAV